MVGIALNRNLAPQLGRHEVKQEREGVFSHTEDTVTRSVWTIVKALVSRVRYKLGCVYRRNNSNQVMLEVMLNPSSMHTHYVGYIQHNLPYSHPSCRMAVTNRAFLAADSHTESGIS
jgi:hypothetical protein